MKFKRTLCAFISALMTAALAAGTFPAESMSAESDRTAPQFSVSTSGAVSKNASANNYTSWSKIVNSYLHTSPDGELERVEFIGDKIIVEKYDTETKELISSAELDPELPLMGGFFSGSEYNFIVTGQANSAESDSVEVMRIVKYSKDWERLGAASVYGANTKIPFEGGSLRMAESGGSLYIHTCHKMYASSDGSNHQANMTFVFNESDLSEKDSFYNVANYSNGYASHSFNQFVKSDGEYVYRVDHGDAYPRAIGITRSSVDKRVISVSYTTVLPIPGSIGNNYTGTTVGGFEMSENNLLIAANTKYIIEDEQLTSTENSNSDIILIKVGKDFNNRKLIKLTDHSSDRITARTPQLVKVSDSDFLLMWEEVDMSSGGAVTTKIVQIDAEGEIVSDIVSLDAQLSDCQPVVDKLGNVTWYVTNNSSPIFYSVDPYDLSSAAKQDGSGKLGDVNGDGLVDSVDASLVLVYNASVADGDYNFFTSEQLAVADVNGDGLVDSADASTILAYNAYIADSGDDCDIVEFLRSVDIS